MVKNAGHSTLWGISIALSWTWGLGLFFSVQIALHFGLAGLLAFAIPNAIGLFLFGFLTQRIARRHAEGNSFERHFFDTSNALRFVIIAYQLTAATLTFFAVFRYLFQPLGVDLSLAILLILGAALLLGEQFNIARLKYSHAVMFVLILVCMAGIILGMSHYHSTQGLEWGLAQGQRPASSGAFLGFLIPMIAGLLIGPWLDIQQWQRAIQIHREKGSVRASYLAGGSIFFAILLFHGLLALTVRNVASPAIITPAADGLFHAKDAITLFFLGEGSAVGALVRAFYFSFIVLCILSTLDSAYVAFKWYNQELAKKSEHIVFTFIPESVIGGPVLPMLAAVAFGAAAVFMKFELEYFMSFYASFGVGYAIVFLFRTTYKPQFTNFTQTTLFSVAAFSLGLFGIGYFQQYWFCMALGALIPLIHGLVVISSRVVVDDLQKAFPPHESTDGVPVASVSGKAAEKAGQALEAAILRLDPRVAEKLNAVIHKIEPQAAHALATVLQAVQPQVTNGEAAPSTASHDAAIEHAAGHFEGKWFTYTFMTTYQDTNSVGNVYFGMYPMFVGKTREMFFQAVMPEFDLKTTSFFILTRSFEHKFNVEAKEFEFLTVKIRIESYNRKFATLEHHIFNAENVLLGKGRQVLLFVNSKDYGIIDLPAQARDAFLKYV